MASSKNKTTDAAKVAAPTVAPGEGVTGTASNDEAKVAQASSNATPEYDYVVTSVFKDKNDKTKTYQIGDSVNRFGEERLADLVNRKLVERRIKE